MDSIAKLDEVISPTEKVTNALKVRYKLGFKK